MDLIPSDTYIPCAVVLNFVPFIFFFGVLVALTFYCSAFFHCCFCRCCCWCRLLLSKNTKTHAHSKLCIFQKVKLEMAAQVVAAVAQQRAYTHKCFHSELFAKKEMRQKMKKQFAFSNCLMKAKQSKTPVHVWHRIRAFRWKSVQWCEHVCSEYNVHTATALCIHLEQIYTFYKKERGELSDV